VRGLIANPQQNATHLYDREILLHPLLDLLLLAEQCSPGRSVTVCSVRADRFYDPADQLFGELILSP
jgi:hypothetical protein